MDEIDYNAACGDSSEADVNVKNSSTISTNSCNNFTNHTDLYLEGGSKIKSLTFIFLFTPNH